MENKAKLKIMTATQNVKLQNTVTANDGHILAILIN